MGSWSVYCETSKIAITAGDECVLLPIKKNSGNNGYMPFIPATLPIFGDYNDYGGMENILENGNTKLIEEHFGITIEDFVILFVDGHLTYNRGEASEIKSRVKNWDEIKDWNFMWLNREVYDFMSTCVQGYYGAGHLDFGNKEILELIGFEYIGKTTDKRYDQHYRFNDVDFKSDGTWLHTMNNESIFSFNGDYSSLSKHVTIPEDKKWIEEKSMRQLWLFLDDKKAKDLLFTYMGRRERDIFEEVELNLMFGFQKKEYKTLLSKYVRDFRDYGDLLCGLNTYVGNLHCMSSSCVPYTKYLTPQCGEHAEHQLFLDKFSQINSSKIEEY